MIAMRLKLLKMGKIGLSVCPSDSTITLGLNALKLGLNSENKCDRRHIFDEGLGCYTNESYVTENKQGRTVCPSVRLSVRQSGDNDNYRKNAAIELKFYRYVRDGHAP